MATFANVKRTLDGIAERIQENQYGLKNAKDIVDQTVDDLTQMISNYSDIVTKIDTEAAANPNDPAWQLALSEKDKLVTEFQALKTTAETLKTAMENA